MARQQQRPVHLNEGTCRLDGKRCGSRAKTFASMAVTRYLVGGLGSSLDADRAEQKGRKMAVPVMNSSLGMNDRLGMN
jgi:hypothetical protein